jgi:hypothetical protein
MAVKRFEPGAADELVKTRRAGRAGAGIGIETGFEPRLRDEVIEIDPCRRRSARYGGLRLTALDW